MNSSASHGSASDLQAAINAVYVRLRERGLRKTPRRTAIITYLLQCDAPASIEEIYHGIDLKRCDLVTVYRCINTLAKLGLVRNTFAEDGTTLWDLSLERGERLYVACSRTKKMIRIDESLSSEITRVIDVVKSKLAASGFKNLSHSVQIFGELSS